MTTTSNGLVQPDERVGRLVEALKPLVTKLQAQNWRGIQSTLFRITEDEAYALVHLAAFSSPEGV